MNATTEPQWIEPYQGYTYRPRQMTAEIWRCLRPQVLDFDVHFRRPIFWDDTVTVMVDERGGDWCAICLVKDGKVATEARINRIG